MSIFKGTSTIDFPAADNTVSTAYIEIHFRNAVNTLTVAWDGLLPAGGALVAKTLKVAGDPATAADWVPVAAAFTTPGTVFLAGVQGLRVYGLSGTGTGNVVVTVVAN